MPKSGQKQVPSTVRVQYGALPYRFTVEAALEILLVTTRRTNRWIIPKGWPIRGLSPPQSAEREAFEEAGAVGKIGAKAVGLFKYNKEDENGVKMTCEVKVFPLQVARQEETWPEFEQRTFRWASPLEALSLIEETELKTLVQDFAARAGKRAVAEVVKAPTAVKVGPRKPIKKRGRRQSG